MADILGSIFGSKPEIADYQSLDLSQEQLDALMGDLAAFPQISQLGEDFQKTYLQELNTAIPGFGDILAEGGTLTRQMEGIAGTELSGQLPADVAANVQRTSAFQNLQSGAGGSMADANTARNYGLTSLDLINQGANLAGEAGNAAQRWASVSGATASGNVMAGMMVTPQQRAEFDKQQNLIEQAVQQAKNNVAAQANPALQQLNQWVEKVGGAVVGTYLGAKPGTDYGTQYDPSKGTGLQIGADPKSDVSNPGYYVNPNSGPAGSTLTTNYNPTDLSSLFAGSNYDFGIGPSVVGNMDPLAPGGIASGYTSLPGPYNPTDLSSLFATSDNPTISSLLNSGTTAFDATQQVSPTVTSSSPFNPFGTPNNTGLNIRFGG